MTIDTRLSTSLSDRYLIEREVGHGGMATVYLAEDIKHSRKVALKVLRPELAAVLGAERFLTEIKVTANLHHPHILPLHDSGEAGGFLFYVMPYVDGESLRERLNREKQLPLSDALRIGRECASALDYAHRHGVIHRDIKPENILLHEGQAFIADFGIALAVRAAGGHRMTETGLSLGTPHYMSPEQAMGERDLGPRSDIYALGSVIYEMLVGEPPFTGATAQAIVAKVLTDRVHPIRPLRSTVPPHVEEAVLRSLEKLPADRWGTGAEFAQALEMGSIESRATAASASLTDSGSRVAPLLSGRPRFFASAGVAWIVAGVLGIVASVLGLRLITARAERPPVVRFGVDLDKTEVLPDEPSLALSPDGSELVVSVQRAGRASLFRRGMNEDRFTEMPGTDGGYRPFFSPDGKWVGFIAAGKLKKVPAGGGTAVELIESSWGGGAWGTDGTIIYTPDYKGGLWRLPPGGGKAEMITTPDSAKGELAHWWPQFLPDQRHVIFTNFSTPIERAKIEVVDLKTGAREVLVEGGIYGRYVETGHLLYGRGDAVLAIPFDVKHLATSGSAVPVVSDVDMVSSNGLAAYAVAPSGDLAYVPGSTMLSPTQPEWIDRDGRESLLKLQPAVYYQPRLSPDNRRLAITIGTAVKEDVWIYDFDRDILSRLTSGTANDFGANWTADSRRVIYSSERPVFDLYWRTVDASSPEESLLVSQYDKYAGSLSPDGKLLAFSATPPSGSEIWVLPLDGSGQPRAFLQKNGGRRPAFSPDGKWIAFDSDESGRREVYLQSFPDPARARHQVSIGGGSEAYWTKGGSELVYRNADSVMAVALDLASGRIGRPTVLFTGSFTSGSFSSASYQVTRDGNRFLMIRRIPELAPRQVNVVLNWFEELKEKAGGR
ncbi:MAG TPA: protein kinase [Gemmatimonadales bacterium]